MSAAPRGRPLPRHWWSALGHPWTWQMAWRDSRSQRKRLLLFSLSIVAGIGALVTIHSLRAALQEGVYTQAKSLLGSDLHIATRDPFTPETLAAIGAKAQGVSREVEFSSMLLFPKSSGTRLVSVRGLEGGFPFYGEVKTEPAGMWARLPESGGVLVERVLLDQFDAKIGDTVKVGALELPIVGTVEKTPPRTSRFGGFAPEIYLRLADLPKTGLLGESRIAFNHLHLRATPQAVAAWRKEFAGRNWRFETPDERRQSLGNALDNAEEFLGLIAIASLVLGAIGVAGAIHAHVSRRVPHVAILRCLGCPGELAFGIYLAQAIALGLVAAMLGAALGVGLHLGIVAWYRESLPFALNPAPSWAVVARTTAGGWLFCGIFALLPLLRVRDIPPAAALRDGEGPALNRRLWPLYLALAVVLAGLAMIGHPHRLRALAMAGGLAVTFGVLAAVAKGLTALARRSVRPAWPYLLRQGVSNLFRPHNQTLLFLLSLGLGTFLLLTVLLARTSLLERLSPRTFEESPSVYLIDVQSDQVRGVSELVRAQGLPVLETAPLVTMRIASVKGVPVAELLRRNATPRWVLEREYRSSYRDHLVATEKVVDGTWTSARFEASGGPALLSLEKEVAKDLHAAVGDEVVLDVQGIPIRSRVASLREVDWSKFSLNFFMVFQPGVLEAAPGFHVITTRLPAGRSSGELQRALVQKFPNVTAIDLTLILDQVRSILQKVAHIISVLAGFTVLAGLPILAATLLQGRDQRLRESVLLRTLGASARQVRIILFVEYATLGLLSALAGVGLAAVAHAALAHWVFKANPWPGFGLVASAFLGAVALAVLGGLLLSRGVSRHPPLEVLRDAG